MDDWRDDWRVACVGGWMDGCALRILFCLRWYFHLCVQYVYIYEYMYVCYMYTCMYVFKYVYVFVCMLYVYMYICFYICMSVCTYNLDT
jgi:hypothetical protein